MKKYIMSFVPGREALLKVLVVALALTTLAYAEYMVWNDTVNYVSGEMTKIIQEDNGFFAQGQ